MPVTPQFQSSHVPFSSGRDEPSACRIQLTTLHIAFRFRPIYGLAAIVALFHDVFITVGFFSISYKEIFLTVIAALLTLVGYSINDTIVVFDRVRENLKLRRRDDLTTIINTSINQTLNRTILTSGMT